MRPNNRKYKVPPTPVEAPSGSATGSSQGSAHNATVKVEEKKN